MRRMPTAVSRYAVGGQPSDCRKGRQHVSLTYTTARCYRVSPAVRRLPLLSARAAFPPAVLALGLVAAVPGTGYAEATRASPAAPLALLEPAASAACWLLGMLLTCGPSWPAPC